MMIILTSPSLSSSYPYTHLSITPSVSLAISPYTLTPLSSSQYILSAATIPNYGLKSLDRYAPGPQSTFFSLLPLL